MNLRPILLLPVLLLLQPSSVQGETRVSEESIRLSTDTMRQREAGFLMEEGMEDQISGVVRVIYHDTRGDLWFGTQDGVCRYDGAVLVYYDIRNEYDQGITVKDIVEDKDGNIWFGTTGGVTRFDGEFFTSFTEEDGLLDRDVWCLFADRERGIWIGTYGGVCRFDGKTFSPFPLPPAAKRDPNRGVSSRTIVWCIAEDHAGNMWFAAEGSVYKHGGEALSRVPVMEEESETHVSRILEDSNRNLWFSTAYKGLIRFDGHAFTNISVTAGLSGTEVGRVCEDESGNIWFPVENVGVYRYDGTSFKKFSEADGLASTAAHFAYTDREGRVWLGGWKGAYCLNGDSFVNVTRDGPW